jgi:predicted alpha/beta-hydrolase family hydrolase
VTFHGATGDEPAVRGTLHAPAGAAVAGLVLTHGAGSSSESPLLQELADALASRGVAVLRCDLPFRQARPHGPPSPGGAARDRAGLRAAVAALARTSVPHVSLGGQSYGGRQASLLAAEDPAVTPALLLLSYPLHPPGRPENRRVAHFPTLRTPALFVHGTDDPFGSVTELQDALALIPASAALARARGRPSRASDAAAPRPETWPRASRAVAELAPRPAIKPDIVRERAPMSARTGAAA